MCNKPMQVQKLKCPSCDITVEGRFSISRLAQLDTEQQEFIERFILASGSLKEVAKEMNISYPTVRSKLDKVIDTLKYSIEQEEKRRKEILDAVEQGKISAEKAAELLRGI